jgi:hypothetical protein
MTFARLSGHRHGKLVRPVQRNGARKRRKYTGEKSAPAGWQIFNDFLRWIGSFAVPGTCLQLPNAI